MVEDPRCPQCGGKIGARAQWCMHCGAEFAHGGQGPVDHATGDDPLEALLALDAAGFAAHLDDNPQLRGLVAIALGVATWYLVQAIALPSVASGIPGGLAGAAVALAGLAHDDGATLLVRGLYYVAAALVGTRLLVPLLLVAGVAPTSGALLLAFLHVPTLVAAGLLVYAGRWLAEQIEEGGRRTAA